MPEVLAGGGGHVGGNGSVVAPVTTPVTTPVAAADGAALSVAVLSTWETVCGIADYSADLVTALRRLGHTVHVTPIDRVALQYMSVTEIGAHYRALVAGLPAAADVVHIQHEFGFFAGPYGYEESIAILDEVVQAVRRRGLPVVFTMHTDPVFLAERPTTVIRRVRHRLLVARWRRFAAAVSRDPGVCFLVHSGSTRRLLVQNRLAADRVAVIAQGIEPRSPARPGGGAAVRARLGIPPGALVLGLFGFMSAYKGYRTALRAMRALPPDVHLLLVGGPHPLATESALEHVLRFRERNPGIGARVHVTGFVPHAELTDHREAIDICIAPYDAWPPLSSSAAVSWALASGRPLVATRIPAFRELDERAGCVELVNPEQPRELAFAVARLAADPARRALLVRRADAWCAANGWDRRATEHAALYVALRGRMSTP